MKPESYLTEEGKRIFTMIAEYLERQNRGDAINTFELSMLANSFDMYAKAAKIVKKDGYQQMNKNGVLFVSPNYTVMKTEYTNILKHAPKFGINPVDVSKILRGEPKKQEDLLDAVLKR